MKYVKDKYGFWKQTDPEPFNYDLKYRYSQSTNVEMAYLRLGWLLSFFDIKDLKRMNAVDIGCGNGIFVDCCIGKFKQLCKYDVTPPSISDEKLKSTYWNMVILTDVLEHYTNIDDIYDLDWQYMFLSYPETPIVDDIKDLYRWRHFKPNEHIYLLNSTGVMKWLSDHKCSVFRVSNFEDIIRTRWDPDKPNITSMLIKRRSDQTIESGKAYESF